METEKQRIKEEDQNNADTYRFINISPPKKQLMASIIHAELKKKKKRDIISKKNGTRCDEGEALKE